MRTWFCGLLTLACLLLGQARSDDATDADQANLQGSWRLVELRTEAKGKKKFAVDDPNTLQRTFAKPDITDRLKDDTTRGKYSLNVSEDQKTIDITWGDSEPEYGIYKLDGDDLTIASKTGANTAKARPKEFKVKAANEKVQVFRREASAQRKSKTTAGRRKDKKD
jgi:uncharacterized protein (TIGR03067 family)